MTQFSRLAVRRLAIGLLVTGLALLIAVIVLNLERRGIPLPINQDSEPWFSGIANAIGALALLAIGGYLAVRLPRNTLAWLMLVAGFGYSLHLFALAYTYTSYLVAPRPLPLTPAMFVLAAVGLSLVLPTIPLLLVLFPAGRLPSPRWRFAYWMWLVVVLIFGGITWLSPSGRWVPFENPLALSGTIAAAIGLLSTVAWFSSLFMLLVASVSTIVRGIRARGLERQQFKWLAVAAVLFLSWVLWINVKSVWSYLVSPLVIAAVPMAIAVAVVRYRLWDLGALLRRTTAYTILTALLSLIYFGTIVVLQRLLAPFTGESTPAIILSTLLISALFLPLRRRIQSTINRRFFRQKYDAEKVLERFAATARDETDLDALTAELVRVIQETMQPEQVSVWLRPMGDTPIRSQPTRVDIPRADGRFG